MSHYAQLYSGENSFQSGTGYNRGIQLYRGPIEQRGKGYNRGIDIYRGPLLRQNGAGLGNFFSTAVKYLRPLLFSGLNALASQGVESGGTILSQLGKKDLKTILNEESQKAVKNLSDKAIQKLKRAKGDISSVQTGSGEMPIGLSPLQLQRFARKSSVGIKRHVPKKRKQSLKQRKLGTTIGAITKGRRQIGQGRKKRTKKQVGGGRKARKKKSVKKRGRSKKAFRTLDIFN